MLRILVFGGVLGFIVLAQSCAPQEALPAPTAMLGGGGSGSAENRPLAAGATRFTLVPDGSAARYVAREQLANRTLPNAAVGATKGVTGVIVFDDRGTVVTDESKLVVDLKSLSSDSRVRDRFLRDTTLRNAPSAEFTPKTVKGLPLPLPATGEAALEIAGDLKVNGVAQPVTWQATAQFANKEVTGTATTTITLQQFNIQTPRVPSVLGIEPNIRLELDFKFSQSS